MKYLIIFIGIFLLGLILFIAFPMYPDSWAFLSRGMTKDEIHEVFGKIENYPNSVDDQLSEEFSKEYLLGKWIVVLHYDDSSTLRYAHMYYKSKIFPFIKRARNIQ